MVSTKIPVAYRFGGTSAEFWAFTRDTKRKATEEIRDTLRAIADQMIGNPEFELDQTEFDRRLKHLKGKDKKKRLRRTMVYETMAHEYTEQSNKMLRGLFDFDVSIGVWELKGSLFLIPQCDMQMRRVLDFLAEDPRLEDFCYWNNVDEPEGVSRREWARRKRSWDAIHEAGWSDHIVIELCTWQTYWRINPYNSDRTP